MLRAANSISAFALASLLAGAMATITVRLRTCAERLVADVAAVLGALDQLGVRYVTAADFEDDLPRGGRSRT